VAALRVIVGWNEWQRAGVWERLHEILLAELRADGTFAWLSHYKRLLVRYDRRQEIHEAFLALACCLVCFRRLQTSVNARSAERTNVL